MVAYRKMRRKKGRLPILLEEKWCVKFISFSRVSWPCVCLCLSHYRRKEVAGWEGLILSLPNLQFLAGQPRAGYPPMSEGSPQVCSQIMPKPPVCHRPQVHGPGPPSLVLMLMKHFVWKRICAEKRYRWTWCSISVHLSQCKARRCKGTPKFNEHSVTLGKLPPLWVSSPPLPSLPPFVSSFKVLQGKCGVTRFPPRNASENPRKGVSCVAEGALDEEQQSSLGPLM